MTRPILLGPTVLALAGLLTLTACQSPQSAIPTVASPTSVVTAAPTVAPTTVTAAQSTVPIVQPGLETQPVLDLDPDAEGAPADARRGDADDPAIWLHPTDPAQSLVIGALKDGGLDIYDLDGQTIQSISPAGARYNNVDVVYNFPLGGSTVDLAVATDRYGDKLAFYAINPETRQVTDVSDPANGLTFTPAGEESNQETTAYGIALYRSAGTEKFYAFVSRRDRPEVGQFEFMDNGSGQVTWQLARSIPLPAPEDNDLNPQAEGMVADQDLAVVYIAQEDIGIWKFDAEPQSQNPGVLIHAVAPQGDTLTADAEGLTIYYGAEGTGYLLASSQGDNRFSVYTRAGANDYLGSFFIGEAGENERGIDGVQGCDGAQVISTPLGERYPQGLFVVHDGENSPALMVTDEGAEENANTNFKFVPWQAVANAFTTPLMIDTASYNPRAQSSVLP
jgi:3-phytase